MARSSSSTPVSPAVVSTYDRWDKTSDLQVHSRLVTIAPHGSVVELRDYIVSLDEYGRGFWLQDSPQIRAVFLDTAATAGQSTVPAPMAGPAVLARLPKAPGVEAVLRVRTIDGTPRLEFREQRNGQDGRGLWIPWDARAQGILSAAQTLTAQTVA